MKVKQLLKFLQEIPDECMEKEVTYYDYQNNIAYNTPPIPTFVDLSDEKYLDFCFNMPEDYEY